MQESALTSNIKKTSEQISTGEDVLSTSETKFAEQLAVLEKDEAETERRIEVHDFPSFS